MAARKRRQISLVWAQFAPYHVDRCEAVAVRLAKDFDVQAVEVASRSETYAWEPAGAVAGASKVTLFPEQSFESIPAIKRAWALFKVLRRSDYVFFGIGYNERDIILLSFVLRLFGVCPIMMSDSKYDDRQRLVWFELFKSVILSVYGAGLVAGRRQVAYFKFLNFRRRLLVKGYDTVGVDRIRSEAGIGPRSERDAGDCYPVPSAPGLPFGARNFVFVGRFVSKKNLFVLLEAYGAYLRMAGHDARRLVLIGDGPDGPMLRARIDTLGIGGMVDLPGFKSSSGVAIALSKALALILISTEEQWGLVVNEALAFGLPIIASQTVGACDTLVRNLINGFIVESHSVEAIAFAMLRLSTDEALWANMVAESGARAWMGDTGRFADAIEFVLHPDAPEASESMRKYRQAAGVA